MGYHRLFGDAIIPHLPDTPSLSSDDRLRQYGAALQQVRSLMPDSREVRDGDSLTMQLKISSPIEFPDYALCLWGIPAPFSTDRGAVETNAKDYIPVRNTAGEYHLVLMVDLQREMTLSIRVAAPAERAGEKSE